MKNPPESSQPPAHPPAQASWYGLLNTVYRLKIGQMFLLIFLAAILFYLLAFWLESNPDVPALVRQLPVRALGDACLTAVLVGFTYEWLVRHESEGKLREVFEEKLAAHDRAIVEHIPRALLTDKQVMARVLSESQLDQVMQTGLELKLGDPQLADELYNGLLHKTITYDERRENYEYRAHLTLIDDLHVSQAIRTKYYQAYVDLRYETRLTHSRFLATCASHIQEYDRLLQDPSYQLRWLFPSTAEFPEVDENAFNVTAVNIGGLDLQLRREKQAGQFLIIGEHPGLAARVGSRVTIRYRYQVKILKRGHLLTLNIAVPTRKVTMELDFARTDIHHMNVLDLFVSAQPPIIQMAPSERQPHKINVEINDWVLPKGGVVFVWTLRPEMSPEFMELLRASTLVHTGQG